MYCISTRISIMYYVLVLYVLLIILFYYNLNSIILYNYNYIYLFNYNFLKLNKRFEIKDKTEVGITLKYVG